MGVAGHQLHALVAEATGKGLTQHGSSGRFNCIFYGWVIVAVCILCKIFKVQACESVAMCDSVGSSLLKDASHAGPKQCDVVHGGGVR